MIKIVTVADSKYLEFLIPMINSASINFPEADMYINLINVGKEIDVVIKGINNKYEIVHEEVKLQGVELRNYCGHRRMSLLEELRKKTDSFLLWVDADSLIVKSCEELIELSKTCDLTMREKQPGKHASGVIGVGSKDICYDFLKHYKEIGEKEKDWGSDQRNLSKAYGDFKHKINYKPLPNKFCDVWLSDEGVIWAIKTKFRNSEKYLTEKKKYEKGVVYAGAA